VKASCCVFMRAQSQGRSRQVVIKVEEGEWRSPLMLGDLRESDVLNRTKAKTGKRDERTTMRNVS